MKRHEIRKLGGSGSGHHGHKGIPGQRGGSAPRGGGGGTLGIPEGTLIQRTDVSNFPGYTDEKGREYDRQERKAQVEWERYAAGVADQTLRWATHVGDAQAQKSLDVMAKQIGKMQRDAIYNMGKFQGPATWAEAALTATMIHNIVVPTLKRNLQRAKNYDPLWEILKTRIESI